MKLKVKSFLYEDFGRGFDNIFLEYNSNYQVQLDFE